MLALNLVDMLSVGDQGAVRLEPLSACVAGVGPLASPRCDLSRGPKVNSVLSLKH